MEVVIAEKCGFCPGVRNAISIAEEILTKESSVYSLGPIIHNEDVVKKLAKSGLKTVESCEQINSGTVLIRSHGASVAQIAGLEEKGLKIVDATCVLVKRVQKIAERLDREGFTVVIIGDENHPEVQSVVGCADKVVVVGDKSVLNRLPENGRLGIVCQTTKGPEYFGEMLSAIVSYGFDELKVINTLCKETIRRQQSAIEVCKKVDVMFVLGGLTSANTRTLAELCKKYNNQTFHLQNWKEFDRNMVFSKTRVGVTAGASTPDWIITDFVENLEKL